MSNPEHNQASLTINDLTALKQLIEVASARGAYKPNEMISVGQVYTKLELFLTQVQAQAQQAQAQQEPEQQVE